MSMKLSGKKLTTAILAGLMGATMFGGSVFAEVSDQEFIEVRQGVNSNKARISQLENAQSTAKDYSTDIAANKKAIADETTARKDADTKLQGSVDANAKAVADETKARQDADTKLQGSVDANAKAIANEATARTEADTKLQGSVDANAKAIANEATARTEADTKLDTRITNVKDYLEKQTAADYVSKTDAAVQDGAVAKADKTIGENVTNLDGALAKETAARIGADAAQDKVMQQVNQNVADSFNTLNQNIGTITDQLNKNDLAEAQARDAADQKLQGNITDIQNTLKDSSAVASADATKAATQAASDATTAAKNANDVANGLKDRVDLISNNQNVTSESDLIKKDQSVGQNLTNVDTALHKEIAARIGADKEQDEVIKGVNDNLANSVNTINKNVADGFAVLNATDQKLQGNIDAEATARDAADQAETKVRADKDTEHDTAIAANKKAIGDEAAARESGDNALQNQFKKESAARQADISRLDNKIHDVSKEVDTVGALSMAMSGLHPLSYDEGDARFQLSAAVGTYDGTEALALGGFYHFNRDSMLSVGVATDLGADEHRMGANVGYTRRIGQGGHVSRPSEGTVSDIMKDIKNLEQKQAKMEQENEQLKQQLAALKK